VPVDFCLPSSFSARKKFSTALAEIALRIAQNLVKPSDATSKPPHELRYTHFGVLFSGASKPLDLLADTRPPQSRVRH
jgi:hypothetical protein